MRLDKYIADTGIASRKEAAKAARSGGVLLDGKAVRDLSVHIDENTANVTYLGQKVVWQKYVYVMLNKPAGYISSTEKSSRTVMTLLPPEFSKMEMFPCGRLDVDTHGLLIVTNDGPLAHCLLSPKHHAEKTYYWECSPPVSEDAVQKFSEGIDIGDHVTKPALLTLNTSTSGEVILTEGKFHQIKRMFEAVGSKITYLKRIKFADIPLDETLGEGEWRQLTDKEIETLRQYAK